jgi:hypothetical protein
VRRGDKETKKIMTRTRPKQKVKITFNLISKLRGKESKIILIYRCVLKEGACDTHLYPFYKVYMNCIQQLKHPVLSI